MNLPPLFHLFWLAILGAACNILAAFVMLASIVLHGNSIPMCILFACVSSSCAGLDVSYARNELHRYRVAGTAN